MDRGDRNTLRHSIFCLLRQIQKFEGDKGIALEKDVTLGKGLTQIIEVEGLEVAAHVGNEKIVVVSQLLDIFAGSEMIIDAVDFAGSGSAGCRKGRALGNSAAIWDKIF